MHPLNSAHRIGLPPIYALPFVIAFHIGDLYFFSWVLGRRVNQTRNIVIAPERSPSRLATSTEVPDSAPRKARLISAAVAGSPASSSGLLLSSLEGGSDLRVDRLQFSSRVSSSDLTSGNAGTGQRAGRPRREPSAVAAASPAR